MKRAFTGKMLEPQGSGVNKRSKTTFNERKMFNTGTESKEETLMGSSLYVI